MTLTLRSKIRGAALGVPVDITIKDAWDQFEKQDSKCALTQLKIEMPKNSKTNYQHTASLDRINNSLGYCVNNIQWLHKEINRMKSDLEIDKFLVFCKLVTERNVNDIVTK